jgi:Bacterial regulatory proteins, tetR family
VYIVEQMFASGSDGMGFFRKRAFAVTNAVSLAMYFGMFGSEFARSGLHGTPVDRIARRVGVAHPYVFSLFGSKRELFLCP